MRDYFAVLGLKRSASDAEVREAYRKLAKEFHPDANHDPKAATRMQLLNEAKTVLFDPVKSREHRISLALRDELARKHLDNLIHSSVSFQSSVAATEWGTKDRKKFYVISGIVVAAVIAITAGYFLFSSKTKPVDPLRQLLARNPDEMLFPPAQHDADTVPDVPAPELKHEAEIFDGFGAYALASKYWRKYLDKSSDTFDHVAIDKLWKDYFKMRDYPLAVETIVDRIHDNEILASEFYELGTLFDHASRPFDARSAYEETVILADRSKSNASASKWGMLAKKKLGEAD